MPQSTVTDSPSVAFAGMRADMNPSADDSFVNEEASAEIPFGVAVAQGAADKGALLLAATSDQIVGVVVHSHAYAKDSELGTTGLKPDVTMGVVCRGRVWVQPEEAVSPGDAVRVRAVAAGAEQAGAFRTTADGTDTIDISNMARWITSGTSSTPAILEIDVNNDGGLGTADT